MSIAQLVGDMGWREVAEHCALTLSGISADDDQPEKTRLLADVRRVFDKLEEPYLSAKDLIDDLKALPESELADSNKGRGLSAAQLAKRLRWFESGPGGLHTRPTRFGEKTGKRWHREDFAEGWLRYLPSEPKHPKQTNETGPHPPHFRSRNTTVMFRVWKCPFRQ